jgi:Protein of unknown function (DUF3551)
MTRFWIVVAGSCLLMALFRGAQDTADAQQTPYCAQYSDGTSPDCEFSSLQMCEQSVTGIGGVCIQNPYGPNSPPNENAGFQGAFRFSPVPPPPQAQQSSVPLQLPDSAQSQPCNSLIDGTYCASAGSIPQIQSLSNDLAIGEEPPVTLGANTFRAGHNACIGLFGPSSCGGS